MLNWAPLTFDPSQVLDPSLSRVFSTSCSKLKPLLMAGLIFYSPFASKYATPEVEQQMRGHCWCPSSIEGASDRLNVLRTLHMLSKIDKSVLIARSFASDLLEIIKGNELPSGGILAEVKSSDDDEDKVIGVD